MTLEELFTNIANAIRSKKKTTVKIKADNFATEINNLKILDTSDATATADDILKDKTAYVKGVKLTGTYEGENSEYNAIVKPDILATNVVTSSTQYIPNKLIVELPSIDTSGWVSTAYMFNRMENLEKIGYIDTTNVTNMSYMFNLCKKLKEIPNMNTENVVNMSNMFNQCSKLERVGSLNTTNVTNMDSMFYACSSLIEIEGELDMINVTNASSFLYNCSKLENVKIKNLNVTGQNISNCTRLSKESLLYLLNNLVPTTTEKTITLGATNYDKLSSEEIKIGTNKGWTVKRG